MTVIVFVHSSKQAKDGMEQEERTKDHFLGVMATDVPLGYLQGFLLRPLVSSIATTTGLSSSVSFNLIEHRCTRLACSSLQDSSVVFQ